MAPLRGLRAKTYSQCPWQCTFTPGIISQGYFRAGLRGVGINRRERDLTGDQGAHAVVGLV